MSATNDDDNEALRQLRQLDDGLAEYFEDRMAELGRQAEDEYWKERIRDARSHLGDVIDKYAYDDTGQDGEREIEAAAQAYIDEQDSHLRATDPERWAEKQMGC